ncbi:hypothetical protein CALCODRAFT_322547 [Calocera cornea HHB12733]|uniref:Uncharacterized protein n=1 Tax=Calocera cornea HHB12733 TaxID=1353952 RepID=A0A165F503_9BASI|nr:hypothetical protein CALCODRAFT_322547 [Calocera cornea HHB12733]
MNRRAVQRLAIASVFYVSIFVLNSEVRNVLILASRGMEPLRRYHVTVRSRGSIAAASSVPVGRGPHCVPLRRTAPRRSNPLKDTPQTRDFAAYAQLWNTSAHYGSALIAEQLQE